MTLVQTHPRPAGTGIVHEPGADGADAVNEAGPRVWKDMTVEVALSVMAGARVGHLLVCDEDGRRTGLVTRAGLTAVRDAVGYTDRVRLRDVIGGSRSHGSRSHAVRVSDVLLAASEIPVH